MIMWINSFTPSVGHPAPAGRWAWGEGEEMAYPARLVFTPFVVVVGGK
jgi:hypothetical protein